MKLQYGNQDPDIYSFESASLKGFPLFEIPSVHIKNLKFSNQPEEDYEYISGKVFLVPAANDFYHALTDTMAHYESLKTVYPDLKIIFCSNDNMYTIDRYIGINRKYMLEILKIYNIEYKDILDIKNKNYIFEEVIHLPHRSQWNQDRIVPFEIQQNLKNFTHDETWSYRKFMINSLKQKFYNQIIDKEPKKIYASRMPYKTNPIDYSKLSDEDQRYWNFRSQEINRQYKDEEKLIDYFLNKGYEVLNFGNMSLIDQISECYYSTELAGINGSNIFNFIWAKPETRTHIIYVTNAWNYGFWKYFDYCKLNYKQIGLKEVLKVEYLNRVDTGKAVIHPPIDFDKLYFADHKVLIDELESLL